MATIYQLTIERFRGIEALKWAPAPGLNSILGGGDVAKTTILDAIGLLFSPTNAITISDTEYHWREDRAGFSIEAVLGLPSAEAFHQYPKQAWVWAWDGKEAVVPAIEDGSSGETLPVYRLRVRGTDDLELVYELVQPDGTGKPLQHSIRRAP